MSYCRFGPESDLYVVAILDGYECLNCKLMPEEYGAWHGKTRMELFNHFMDHKDCGDKVPMSAIVRLTKEISAIPQEHWENEFKALMGRLEPPSNVLKEFMYLSESVNREHIKNLLDRLVDAIADLDELNWPVEDDD